MIANIYTFRSMRYKSLHVLRCVEPYLFGKGLGPLSPPYQFHIDFCIVDDGGYSEVDDPDSILWIDEDVLGFQIEVEDGSFVGSLDGLCDLPENVEVHVAIISAFKIEGDRGTSLILTGMTSY